jgi:hypothetical protein
MAYSNYDYGVCGVYCGQCPRGTGRVSHAAGELKRLIDVVRFEFLKNIPNIPFDFDNFRKGLEWFHQYGDCTCPGKACSFGYGKCADKKGLDSCLECPEYLTCEQLTYIRETYPFVIDNYHRVQQVGLAKHLEEEEQRAKAGVCMMAHLQRMHCKSIKLPSPPWVKERK